MYLKGIGCCKELYNERKLIEGINIARDVKFRFCPYCGTLLRWAYNTENN